jgi:serine/threonine protein kinase
MGSGSSASDVSISHSPTLTHQHTGAGVIIGTAAYMSPEQARGRTVDKRTDIWSFGCVLYECLTGRQAFAGETVSDLIARILEREPEWEALPSRTPPRIRDLLKRCMEKDARQRLRDIGDARIEIDNVIATKSSSPEAMAASSRRSRSTSLRWFGVVALFFAAVASTYFLTAELKPAPGAPPVRFEVSEKPGTRMDADAAQFALSPDGRAVAFAAGDSLGTRKLWIRRMDELDPREVAGSENAQLPFWSSDSRQIGWFQGGTKLVKFSVGGGTRRW